MGAFLQGIHLALHVGCITFTSSPSHLSNKCQPFPWQVHESKLKCELIINRKTQILNQACDLFSKQRAWRFGQIGIN